MKAASLNEIKKQMSTLDKGELIQVCTRLARYKKENKELLTYLLFEANDEQSYVLNVKGDVEELFAGLPTGNVYFVKKSIRKILRYINRQIRYSGTPQTELEIRIMFCMNMRSAGVPLHAGTVLYNLYQQQLKKILKVWSALPEDLRFDYERDLRTIGVATKDG